MKRSTIITFLVILSIVLTACGGSGAKKTTESPFIGGSEGLIATFEPLSIQEDGVDTIFDSDDFPLEIILKNKGEEVIPKDKVTLRLLGPPQDVFKNVPQWELKNENPVEKVTEFNTQGGEEIVAFTPKERALYTAQVTGFTDVTFNLEYSYDYKTHTIVSDVCFKGDITDPKVCEVKESKGIAVSGAPIAVTSANQDTGGKGIILLKFEISNLGQGDSTIVGKEFDRRFSQVSYTIEEADKWKCSSGGRVDEARLIDGKAQIVCRLKDPLGENELFTKPVRLTLDYTYKELVLQKLRIKESTK